MVFFFVTFACHLAILSQQHPEVGNVFEEKPEFIDSLQKPVTAVSHSRLMFEPEDMKPGIVHVGLPTHEIIVTSEDGSHAYASREMILQQVLYCGFRYFYVCGQ